MNHYGPTLQVNRSLNSCHTFYTVAVPDDWRWQRRRHWRLVFAWLMAKMVWRVLRTGSAASPDAKLVQTPQPPV